MPYTCKLNNGKYLLTKKGSIDIIGTHDSKKACIKQMRALYASEARSPKNLIFNGYISTPWNLEDVISNSEKEIRVAINTRGGDFLDAINIHNKLRNSGKRIIVYIDPFAVSAGAVIALAGDEIYMPENGLLMFHTPRVQLENTIKDANQLEIMIKALRSSEDILVKTLQSRTQKSEDECRKIMENDTYFTAEQALSAGIIDEIIPIYRDFDNESQISNYNFPERIVNYIQEKRDMPLKEVLEKFNVSDEDALVNLITNLQKGQQKPPTEIKPSIVNMVKKARETELNNLVDDGKVAPAVITDLKLTFLNEDKIKYDAQSDDPNGEFEKLINALSKNEQIINFQGKSGAQTLQLDKKQNQQQEGEDVLAKDMQARREKLKAMQN